MRDQVGGPDGRVAVAPGELAERQVGKSLETILEKKTFFLSSSLAAARNKLECLSLPSFVFARKAKSLPLMWYFT